MGEAIVIVLLLFVLGLFGLAAAIVWVAVSVVWSLASAALAVLASVFGALASVAGGVLAPVFAPLAALCSRGHCQTTRDRVLPRATCPNPQCGHRNPAHARFCANCGWSLGSNLIEADVYG